MTDAEDSRYTRCDISNREGNDMNRQQPVGIRVVAQIKQHEECEGRDGSKPDPGDDGDGPALNVVGFVKFATESFGTSESILGDVKRDLFVRAARDLSCDFIAQVTGKFVDRFGRNAGAG